MHTQHTPAHLLAHPSTDPNRADELERTPLWMAAKNNHDKDPITLISEIDFKQMSDEQIDALTEARAEATTCRARVADDAQPLWWAKGGELIGASPPRIAVQAPMKAIEMTNVT